MLPSPLPHAWAGPLARMGGGDRGAALGYGIVGERACHRAGATALDNLDETIGLGEELTLL